MRASRICGLIALMIVVVIIGGVFTSAFAQASKDYIILAKGQGKGSIAFITNLGLSLVAKYEDIGVVVARSSDPHFAGWATKLPGVQSVTEDLVVQWISPNERAVPNLSQISGADSFLPNSSMFFNAQWALHNIHADQTAAAGYLGEGARVAILDSGIVADHPEIEPNLNLALSKSFVPGEGIEPPVGPYPNGLFVHGTHVAGIVAGSGYRTQGVAPKAEIVAVKVLGALTGSGAFSWIIAGIEYASGPEVNADIINMSLSAVFSRVNAGGGGAGSLISALNRAINHATKRGTLVVSAAGNDGLNLNSNLWSIPAQSGNGIAISATTAVGFGINGMDAPFDVPALYTNYGQSVVNFAAPGGDAPLYGTPEGDATCFVPYIGVTGGFSYPCYVFDMIIAPGGYLTDADGKFLDYLYYWASGTSMATPHVTGVAALIVGKYGHHVLSPAEIEAILQYAADDILKPGADPYAGKGRINAARALGLQ